jgi:Fe-S cluster biogenesis protein NfuA
MFRNAIFVREEVQMFIQTEQTPNPATLKFLPGQSVMEAGTADFRSADAAGRSPLARRLFAVDGVVGVFLGHDFVTVTKAGDQEWHIIKPAVLGAMMDHLTSGEPAVEAVAADAAEPAIEDDEVVGQIKELIETRVRPAVAQDGGDIVFHGFEDGVVYLHMQGACAGCPSSAVTLKMGIENMLRHYVPEVVRVEAVPY